MIELEDYFEDVIGKTLRGTGMADGVLSFLTGIETDVIEKLKGGDFDEAAVRAIAPALGLDGNSLVELAGRSWRPEVVELTGLKQFNTLFDDDPEDPMTVNAYLVWDEQTKEAALFDTGANADEALAFAKEIGVEIKTLFLTHSHLDHIIDRDKIIAVNPGINVYINGMEAVDGATRFAAGDSFSVGALRVSTRLTWGHSPAGTTYVVHGLGRPVAIVGDAIFAQSMGGGVISFHDALATNRAEIFTLEDQTVLCPGHGPMTSVGEEKAHNPFYPEFK
ncbi:MBL fold metallo-hydrolase [Akkermansiaceae bacterium]|nr:MBL fold metallo-hydrolase [Akkermansiaceae bacterium]MDB4332487.1 MBL fold metallo-hydrolase [Akkermansiaceae bacterium]MDB4615333.1 MBL fold metallo-hydrolase [Akkermansiaceae bacterium]